MGRGPPVAGRARLQLDTGLRAGDGDPRAGGNRSAAAPEPRRDDVVGAVAAQAGRPVDGDDAGDHLAAAVRDQGLGALRQPGQGPRGSAADARGRRPAVDPVHHGTAGRHRRDADGARRNAARNPAVAQGVRSRPGSDRAELPRQGSHRDGSACPTPASTTSWRRSPYPGWCWDPRCASRHRPIWCRATNAWP